MITFHAYTLTSKSTVCDHKNVINIPLSFGTSFNNHNMYWSYENSLHIKTRGKLTYAGVLMQISYIVKKVVNQLIEHPKVDGKHMLTDYSSNVWDVEALCLTLGHLFCSVTKSHTH